jgi:hypothetical protein
MLKGYALPPELPPAIIADRMAGMQYPAIAAKYGIHSVTARRICRRAVDKGHLVANQIRYTPGKSRRAEQSAYDARWVSRVKTRCVIDEKGCWLWQGFITAGGYGGSTYRGRQTRVHRAMYQAFHGVTFPRKPQTSICHTCDVRHCCNPDHLWAGSQSQNIRDSVIKGRHQEISKTHCERGHEFTVENTAYRKGREGRPTRCCKACSRGRQRVRWGWPPEIAYQLPVQPLGYISNPNKRNAA